MRRLPPYFNALIAARRAGQVGRHVHLGYWDDGSEDDAFEAAQARMTERIIDLAPLREGQSVLDVACGFGGTLAAIDSRLTRMQLVGLNIDARQLALCRGAGTAPHGHQDKRDGEQGLAGQHAQPVMAGRVPAIRIPAVQARIARISSALTDKPQAIQPNNSPPIAYPDDEGKAPGLVAGDACALPFRAASFDHVFCVEAMFHFDSRRRFLAEAARVLRPGGSLVVSDILLRRPEAAPWDTGTIEAIVRRDYGPWPAVWMSVPEIVGWADEAGLEAVAVRDWSAATLPSYRFVAPEGQPRNSAGQVFRWLHRAGWVDYVALSFRRR